MIIEVRNVILVQQIVFLQKAEHVFRTMADAELRTCLLESGAKGF